MVYVITLFKKPAAQFALATPRQFIALYLLVITIAEIGSTYLNPNIGAFIHVLLMALVLARLAVITETDETHLLIAMIIAPLIRLLSLSLPLFIFELQYWYLIISLPLFVAAAAAMRLMGYSLRDIGIHMQGLRTQMLIALSGIVFGITEFIILKPALIVKNPTAESLFISVVAIFIGTGLMEEVIFRGIMIRAGEKPLGRRGSLLFATLLFTIMHIGWQSLIDLAFVFVAGLTWGYLFQRTRSLIGITIAHTVTNIILFIIMPMLMPTQAMTFTPVPLIESENAFVTETPVPSPLPPGAPTLPPG